MKKIMLMAFCLLLQFCTGYAVSPADSNKSSKELNNALISAVKNNRPEKVQELVQARADVNQEITTTWTHGSGEGCMAGMTIYTLLEYAAIHGYIDIVKELIKAGAVIYSDHPQNSSRGPAALIGASREGHIEVVRELIKAGANVNHADRGDTALIRAAYHGHVDVVRELIKAGADVNDANILGKALSDAADKGHIDVVKELINAGADVNYEYWEDTVLIKASTRGHADVVKELIKAGAHVNQAASTQYAHYKGNTALIEAADRGHVDVIRELIQAGAHVNLTNKNGDTALMCAIKNNDFDVVQSLLQSPEFNAGIWQRIKDSFSDSGTKSINYADKNGDTALILAAKHARFSYEKGNDSQYKRCINSQKIIEELLKTHGIDRHHVNKKGETFRTLLDELMKKSSGYSYL